jgi:hypothetical protein
MSYPLSHTVDKKIKKKKEKKRNNRSNHSRSVANDKQYKHTPYHTVVNLW